MNDLKNWHSVDKELPKEEKFVLAINEFMEFLICKYNKEYKYWEDTYGYEIAGNILVWAELLSAEAIINDLPFSEDKWVDVNDRLPDMMDDKGIISVSDFCLVTMHYNMEDLSEVDIDWCNEFGDWSKENAYREVIAWQPLNVKVYDKDKKGE